MTEPWHKGTRYWRLAGDVILLSFIALFACFVWRPESISSIATMITIITPVIFGGAAAVKHQERRNGS